MQVRELPLQQYMGVVRARNIAGAAGAGAIAVEGVVHGRQHCGMLAHAKVVVRAPDSHLPLTALGVIDCAGK